MSETSMRPTDLSLAFLAAAVATGIVAALVALVGSALAWDGAGWAAIHLALLGGVSLLVIGISQFFVTAFLATTPPERSMVRAQIGCWAGGAFAVVGGISAEIDPLTVAGVALLLAALILYGRSLSGLHSRSLQSAPWASRWYIACAIWLVCGIGAGLAMALNLTWTHGSLLGAHLAFNLGGWLGGAIVGTLHTFAPSLTQTQLRFPRLQPVTFGFWTAGCGVLALGYGFGVDALAILGWSLFTVGAGLLAVNLISSAVASKRPLSLPGRLVIWSQVFLPLGLGFGLVATFGHPLDPLFGSDRAVLAVVLLIGWIGLTVIGSMLHLLSVVVRVRDLGSPMKPANVRQDRMLAIAATGSVGLFAVAQLAGPDGLVAVSRAILLLVALFLAGLVARSVMQAVRLGPGNRVR